METEIEPTPPEADPGAEPQLPENDPGAEPETDEDRSEAVPEAEPAPADPDVVVSIEDPDTGDVSALPI